MSSNTTSPAINEDPVMLILVPVLFAIMLYASFALIVWPRTSPVFPLWIFVIAFFFPPGFFLLVLYVFCFAAAVSPPPISSNETVIVVTGSKNGTAVGVGEKKVEKINGGSIFIRDKGSRV
jgi:hypothetical protein